MVLANFKVSSKTYQIAALHCSTVFHCWDFCEEENTGQEKFAICRMLQLAELNAELIIIV